jgi:beta-lactamase regulating signal transducer with metallopeptidase domain
MEFIFEALFPWLLWIAGGCIILSLLLLVFAKRYTKKMLEKMEQDDTLKNSIPVK